MLTWFTVISFVPWLGLMSFHGVGLFLVQMTALLVNNPERCSSLVAYPENREQDG
jgi:hypothetical protein